MTLLALLALQLVQSPSPMVESTRAHERQRQRPVAGERIATRLGELLLPPGLKAGHKLPLVIHFHGEPWLAEQSVRKAFPKAAVLAVQAGAGSRVYDEAVRNPAVLTGILTALAHPVEHLYLSGFSAGYGAIRAILRQPEHASRVDGILLLDGIHAGYEDPQDNRQPSPADLDAFLAFAKTAQGGQKRLAILHSEIFPGSYASTTESTDWLLAQLGLRRKAVLRWGPLGMQIVSDTHSGRLRVLGFAGNSAPDHTDMLHALPWALKMLK